MARLDDPIVSGCAGVSLSANLVNSTASSIINLGFSVSVLASADASSWLQFWMSGLLFGVSWELRYTFKCCTRAARRSILALLVLLPAARLGILAVEGTGSGLINYIKGRKRVIGKTYVDEHRDAFSRLAPG